MDKREYWKGQMVKDDDHLNESLGPGGTVETAIDNLHVDDGTDGITTGLIASQHAGTPDMTVDVSTGCAYDGDGKRCKVSAGQNVDLSGVTLPAGGNELWVSIFIQNAVTNAVPWVDDDDTAGYWEHTDSFSITIVEGTEGAPPATRASLHATKRLICDVKLVNAQTQILDADIDTSRREESMWDGDNVDIDASGFSVLDTATVNAQELAEDVDDKIIDRSAIIGGYTLASAQVLTRVHDLHIGRIEEDATWVYQLNTSLGGDTMDTWDIQLAGAASPAEQYLWLPLFVPDGAKWLSAGGTCWVKLDVYQDADADTSDITAALYKKAYTDGADTAIGGASATLSSFAAWTELTLSVSSDETIDRTAYSYSVRILAGRDTTSAIESSVRAVKWAVSLTDLGRAVGM